MFGIKHEQMLKVTGRPATFMYVVDRSLSFALQLTRWKARHDASHQRRNHWKVAHLYYSSLICTFSKIVHAFGSVSEFVWILKTIRGSVWSYFCQFGIFQTWPIIWEYAFSALSKFFSRPYSKGCDTCEVFVWITLPVVIFKELLIFPVVPSW